MIINEAGNYTLRYTATDACGNTTVVDRELTVEGTQQTYRTVLYADNTLIINESSSDEAANVALHGQPTNVYAPFDPNGATDADKYIFDQYGGGAIPPWLIYDSGSGYYYSPVEAVEIGSTIQPSSTANWFSDMTECTSIDLTNLDTSAVTSMAHMFEYCSALTSLDLSNFNTSAVTDMNHMFGNCSALTSLNLANFDTSEVTKMDSMFEYCSALTSLDLANFDTSAVTDMSFMFSNCSALTTIYASVSFVVTQVTYSLNMFVNMSTNLVGGAGTLWDLSNPTDKTYAHIDGGTSDPGYFTARP